MSNKETFYCERLSENRAARWAQSPPAAVGSAFDICVKPELAHHLLGVVPESLRIEATYEKQIDAAHRGWALEAGREVLAHYQASGAFLDLLNLLNQSETEPKFEFDAVGIIGGVPFFGIPDCGFRRHGINLLLDWKVRGWFSSASPSKGYLLCRDGWSGKQSRSHGKSHKKFAALEWHGLTISQSYLEEASKDYAAQLAIYSWLGGTEVGSEDWVAQIEELCGRPTRVATHRARVSAAFQLQLLREAQECWGAITTGHIFRHLPREESDARCAMLDQRGVPTVGDLAKQLASIEATYAIAA